MSKAKKKPPQFSMEQLQRQIAKDLAEKNFTTIEEADKYIQEKYLGKEIKIDKRKLSPQEKAMDLVYKARESGNLEKMKALAEKALKIDENCADAYCLLAEVKAETMEEALEFYEKGIEAGKKSLGADFEHYRGRFWGFHETRPYMRAMIGYANILWLLGKKSKSVEIMKEMLELNPEDNQGVRHLLITKLLILNRFLEADKLYEDYEDDVSAQWYYARAYLYFNKKSKQHDADIALLEAMEYNPFVPLYLFGFLDMPDELPGLIGMGDENEAVVYVSEATELWGKNKKAATWFAKTFIDIKNKIE